MILLVWHFISFIGSLGQGPVFTEGPDSQWQIFLFIAQELNDYIKIVIMAADATIPEKNARNSEYVNNIQ